jgi:hypothetical protein
VEQDEKAVSAMAKGMPKRELVHRAQEDGFDWSPIGYKLAGVKQHVEEAFMGNCIVVVQFDLPKRTEEQAIKGATSTATIYRGLAAKGLIRKDYLNGDTGTGGVYLWESRAAAEAWFTEQRVIELTKRFGVRPRLTWYDSHVTVDNLKGETRVDGKTLADVG